MENIIERYGSVVKVEKLWCTEELGMPGYCLLESRETFPGYYSFYTNLIKPKHVFIVSNEKYSLEKMTRIIEKVKLKLSFNFDAAWCQVSMNNNICEGVRIAGIEDYNLIQELQKTFADCGLQLKKKIRGLESIEATIKVKKFFKLIKLENNLYLDKNNVHIGYFTINENISWNKFEQIVKKVKNNWEEKMFDAALAFIYEDNKIIDMIRVYSKEIDKQYLEKLKNLFLRNL
ncbi:MAG: hypothetical protein GX793_05210 [Bacteroidales bacterium]|jgi:hypothetical protein|nr:hypothetical protein [Bacteroidales bacterium]MCK9498301.1 hypothetical protein [Bacteroidales bacterium]MDY0314197.1 hypothetical protein [Bacteroidales bacterium]NLB86441.1 hypothetical protein [Bacteroidales bacterium]